MDRPRPRRVAPLVMASAALLLSASPAGAISPDRPLSQLVHDQWGQQDGLPQPNVTGIARTPDGYLWLAGQEGLVRFDGVRFVLHDEPDGSRLAGGLQALAAR